MNRKRKFEWDALFIVSLVFLIIGTVFTILGAAFRINLRVLVNSPASVGALHILQLIFLVLGLSFLVVGVLCAVMKIKKNNMIDRVISEGYSVMATIVSVDYNYSVTVNGRHPSVLECHYQDPSTGLMHVFMSKDIYLNPQELVGTEIRVYVDRTDYSRYYVDVESVIAL